jgi:hypothetical protein
MAYIVDLDRKCQVCPARATVQVRNHYNAPVGDYCKTHGRKALAEQQLRENESYARQQGGT